MAARESGVPNSPFAEPENNDWRLIRDYVRSRIATARIAGLSFYLLLSMATVIVIGLRASGLRQSELSGQVPAILLTGTAIVLFVLYTRIRDDLASRESDAHRYPQRPIVAMQTLTSLWILASANLAAALLMVFTAGGMVPVTGMCVSCMLLESIYRLPIVESVRAALVLLKYATIPVISALTVCSMPLQTDEGFVVVGIAVHLWGALTLYDSLDDLELLVSPASNVLRFTAAVCTIGGILLAISGSGIPDGVVSPLAARSVMLLAVFHILLATQGVAPRRWGRCSGLLLGIIYFLSVIQESVISISRQGV